MCAFVLVTRPAEAPRLPLELFHQAQRIRVSIGLFCLSVVDAFHAAALENGGKDNCLEARRHDGRLGPASAADADAR